jgi:uncharacterized Zn-binding protein involved in type VI secretion
MVTLWIVDGDTTDHGGTVSVPQSRVDIGGRNVASVGFNRETAARAGEAIPEVHPAATGTDAICEPCLEEAARRGKGLVERE